MHGRREVLPRSGFRDSALPASLTACLRRRAASSSSTAASAHGDGTLDALMRRAIWRGLARALRRRPADRQRRRLQASRDLRDRQRRLHRRAGLYPGPLRRHLRDRRPCLDRAAGLSRRARPRPGGLCRLGSGREGPRLDPHRACPVDVPIIAHRPRDQAGPDRRLGRYRHQRDDPARRDDRQGRDRRRRRGGDARMSQPFAIVAGVPAQVSALADGRRIGRSPAATPKETMP